MSGFFFFKESNYWLVDSGFFFSISFSLSVGVLLYSYLVSDQWHLPIYKKITTHVVALIYY